MSEPEARRSGFVALVGRPNVGKSTLLNRLLGQKISITSPKPQTTRHRILGIKTEGAVQTVYVDTPGVHQGGKRAINRYMNRAALSTLAEVDVIVMLVDGLRWTDEDAQLLKRVMEAGRPVILAVNKVDRIADKTRLLPHLQALAAKAGFLDIVPLSAYSGDNLDVLEKIIASQLPEGDWLFDADQLTDRSERFLAAEIVREKLMRSLGDEVPYALAVELEEFREEEGRRSISAVIWVERSGQKAIVIGKGGEQLKEVGRQARHDMEKLFDAHVFLRLWVKVREGWSDDERSLASLGYQND
ncbi:GTPase Era [Thioalbus denitrificans]|uniref:GTPase Era n=1 Tax=Thioalbus denitrificans TaxID=547122 RepID=A0A369CHC0_9GAMM|nr:GTPase Era [Thioalbus denitrificans]RCX31867.1 GTP-binding protein Era [Thioalbus denitrificans]